MLPRLGHCQAPPPDASTRASSEKRCTSFKEKVADWELTTKQIDTKIDTTKGKYAIGEDKECMREDTARSRVSEKEGREDLGFG